MTTFLTKHQAVTATATVAFSLLTANASQAATFDFQYIFDPANFDPMNAAFLTSAVVNGSFDGDQDGNNFLNVTNIMAEISLEFTIDETTLPTVIIPFEDQQFITRVFTVDGVGTDVSTDVALDPFLSLVEGGNAEYSGDAGRIVISEPFNRDSYSVTPRSVPENNMSGLGWLALATISGLSLRKKKD
jgi:hypothetical protein